MSETTNLNVRVNGVLSNHIASKVGAHGEYENQSEYVRDLIRRDKERTEQTAFLRKKAELMHAFSAPEDDYTALSAADIFARNTL